MEFHFTEPQNELERAIGGHFCINAIGRIEAGDDDRFHDFLSNTKPPPRLTVYIDSLGGDVDAAIGMGRLIRGSWFSTSIGTYFLDHSQETSPFLRRKHKVGVCASAATLMYIGGRLRYFPEGSTFGVHQFTFKNPSPSNTAQSQILSARIASYVGEMGISTDFVELSSATSSSEINVVDQSQLKALNIVTGGTTDADWTVHARNEMMYVRGERDSLFGHHKVMLCYSKGVGFMFWAVIESQGREHQLTKCELVEIVINEEDVRIDISLRCERHVLGMYTNIFARITDEEARAIAFSDSFGVQVRFSDEAPVFVGISGMSTEGGKETLQTFFNVLGSAK